MMKNIIYGVGSNSNDLQKYCDYHNCQKNILYKKLKTGGNDPSVSCRMKYAKRIDSVSTLGKCTKILDIAGNVVK